MKRLALVEDIATLEDESSATPKPGIRGGAARRADSRCWCERALTGDLLALGRTRPVWRAERARLTEDHARSAIRSIVRQRGAGESVVPMCSTSKIWIQEARWAAPYNPSSAAEARLWFHAAGQAG
jgi:hypothetical protein